MGGVVAVSTGAIMQAVGLDVMDKPVQSLTLMAANAVGWELVAHANRRAGERDATARSDGRGSRAEGALRKDRDRRESGRAHRFTNFRGR